MTVKESSILSFLFARLQQLANSRFFFRDVPDPGVWQTIGWWEVRRVPYNLLVDVAGVITGAICFITALVCEHFLGDPIGAPNGFAFFGVLAYGIAATSAIPADGLPNCWYRKCGRKKARHSEKSHFSWD